MAISLWSHAAPFAEGGSESEIPVLIPYVVDAGSPTAAVIVCPGGGYEMLAHHEGEPIALWLNRIGISAFVLKYRVAPYRHPAPITDAQRAIRYVRHHAGEWNIDPQRVGILGFSAGGHLASTAGTHFDAGDAAATDPVDRESCRPDLMILCYPVISFGENRHPGSMRNLIGEAPDEELRRLMSNELQVAADTPPAFLWHTADDKPVPVENSLLFAQALSGYRVPFELHVFPNGHHGLGLAEDDTSVGAWTGLCETWLRKRGF